MKLFIYNLILFIIIFIIFFITIQCNIIYYYNLTSNINGNKTLIISSIHGNELAGYYVLKEFIESKSIIKYGQIKIIPSANNCGLYLNYRNNPFGNYDINRNFPDKSYLNKQQIIKFVNEANWIIDLHEGWDFHKINSDSIGSGIYGFTKKSKKLANDLVYEINKDIIDINKQFTSLNLNIIPNSLEEYCYKNNKNYILVETTGQNDIQPLNIRKNQMKKILEYIINYIHS